MCVGGGGLETIKNSWRFVNPWQWAHAPSQNVKVISFLPTCLGSEQKTRQPCTSLSVPTGVDRLISSKLNAYWATFNKFLWLPCTFERDFDPPMLTFHLRCCWTMGPWALVVIVVTWVFIRSIIYFEGCLQISRHFWKNLHDRVEIQVIYTPAGSLSKTMIF